MAGAIHAEWWFYDNGENMLKGVEGDPDNPIRMRDEEIVDFLSRIPDAVASFNRVVPTMLQDEQTRLYALAAGCPKYDFQDPITVSDQVQHNWNCKGIHTCGPKGGRGYGR